MNIILSETKRESFFLHYFLLGSILLLVAIVQIFYIYFDGRSLPDHDLSFGRSFFSVYHYLMGDHSLTTLSEQLGREHPPYPLILTILSCLGYFLPLNMPLFRLFNFVFYLLLILAGYHIGKKQANRNVGLLCAFILATLPVFDNDSRKFDFQFQAAAITLWAYHYALTIFKTKWTFPNSIMLGLLSGAAIVTHPTAVVLLAPLLAFVVIYILTEGKQSPWRLLKSGLIVIFAMLPILLFLDWFLPPYLSKLHQSNFISGRPGIFLSFFKRAGKDLMFNHRNSLGPFYLSLLMPAFAMTVISLLLNKSQRLIDAFWFVSIFWVFGAMFFSYPANLLPNDFLFLYAPASLVLILGTHSFFALDIHRRWTGPLSLLIVLAIVIGGVWTKIQALTVLSPESYLGKQLDFRNEFRSLQLTKDFGRVIIDTLAKADIPQHITIRQMEIVRDNQTLKLVPTKKMYYILRDLGLFANKRISILTPRRIGLARFRICYYYGNTPLSEKDISAILNQIRQLDPHYDSREQYIIEKRSRRLLTPLDTGSYMFAIMQKTN